MTREVIKRALVKHKRQLLFFIPLLLVFCFAFAMSFFPQTERIVSVMMPSPTPTITPIPTIVPFTTYTKPTLEKKKQYSIYLLGDSMTHAFGPRGGKFNELLSTAYPELFFEISNYAEANQSILLLPARLREPVQADHDLLLKPIIDGDPDVIIIESFGYNPLSQFGITEGLKKQEEVLTEVMTRLTHRFPHAVIMFLAVIAPDKLTYGRAVTGSNADGRWLQAEERIEYITNHINYATSHNIPLINAYQESLDSQGDGDIRYINPVDNIHPSELGLSLMGNIMTKRIVEEKIFPQLQ